ncbi:hypothetical protein AB4305_11870 [Nocardia sp. 2YAB30]|uniref:hypothetical protein n=1 Tax=unclassified Nocardia TaxID=2637762 RepID=UPI003F9E7211
MTFPISSSVVTQNYSSASLKAAGSTSSRNTTTRAQIVGKSHQPKSGVRLPTELVVHPGHVRDPDVGEQSSAEQVAEVRRLHDELDELGDQWPR